MSETIKNGAVAVKEVVVAVVLGMSVLLNCWNAKTVIDQGKLISATDVQVVVNSHRLDEIETHGSRSLESHERMDDARVSDLRARVDKIETALLVLTALPGELKAVSVSIEHLHEGQARIETNLSKKNLQ